jgi:hypothetical protein
MHCNELNLHLPTLKVHKWRKEIALCISRHGHAGRTPFPPGPGAFSKLCIITAFDCACEVVGRLCGVVGEFARGTKRTCHVRGVRILRYRQLPNGFVPADEYKRSPKQHSDLTVLLVAYRCRCSPLLVSPEIPPEISLGLRSVLWDVRWPNLLLFTYDFSIPVG